ncbi:DUF2334 domain-containing protein [Candidatus Poribacteria bacterium]|nr:DUF2334 domain-containing protein [Candidatus Poribacteria bacterium]
MQQHPLYCIYRYDDYSEDLPIVTEILNRIEKYAVPHTFGIIPHSFVDRHQPERKEFLPFTKETTTAKNMRRLCSQGYVEPALHGWNHERRLLPNQKHSEFMGLPYEQQLTKIRAGKACVEEALEQKIETFIPPFNTYDTWTLKACEACNLQVFSADLYGDNQNHQLVFLPKTCTLNTCKQALQQWHQIKDQFTEPIFLVIVYHAFELKESGDTRGYYTLDGLEQLFRLVTSSQEFVLLTLGQAAQRFSSQLTAERYREGQWCNVYYRTRHDSLRKRCNLFDAPPWYYYYPTAHYHLWRERLTRRSKSLPWWILSLEGVRLGWHVARRRWSSWQN